MHKISGSANTVFKKVLRKERPMLTILFRTLFIYAILIATMRLMGKRQIGELEVTDLVTTFLLSEIASLPIADPDIPLAFSVVPMVTLLSLEVLSSFILLRVPKVKNLLSASPTVLIDRGVLDQTALLETRVSLDELMSEVRGQGLTSLEQVECAILEKNGKLTVLPKPKYAPPNAGQLGLNLPGEPLMHIVYSGGRVNEAGLTLIGKDRVWLDRALLREKADRKRLFCVTANRAGDLYCIYRSKKGDSAS